MSLPDFDNTEIAFKWASATQLRRSYWLFKLISFGWLVTLGARFLRFAIWLKLPVEPIMRKTVFAQFCGGETISECGETIDRLAQHGIGTILDFAMEGVGSEKLFEQTTNEIIATVELAARSSHVPFAVFKLTGIRDFDVLEALTGDEKLTESQQASWERIRERVQRICQVATERKVSVLIDAEETWIQGAIDQLAEEMMALHNRERAVVYNTVQLYLRDRLDYLQSTYERAKAQGYQLGFKLVRGAYMEKERARATAYGLESPVVANKNEADLSFDKGLTYCLERLEHVSICAGTHNEGSTLLLVEWMNRHGIRRQDTRIYFAQLLGMSDHITYNLAEEGYNVAKYVPYGPVKALTPYLLRRAQENSSVTGQSSRELRLLSEERKRRNRLS